MKRGIVCWGVILSLVGSATHAGAQVTARGRAFGTLVSVLQLPQLTIRTGDTGEQSATAPGSFSASGTAKTLDASPLAIVINDVTSTDGQANVTPNECSSFVDSVSGQSVVSVLPDQGVLGDGLIEAVVSGSSASVTGSGAPSGDGQVIELIIAGTPIQLPSAQPPNTMVLAGSSILTLNRQVSSSDPVTGSRSLLVQGLRAQLLSDGEVLDVVLSDSEASLTGLPASCFISCSPDLTNSRKFPSFKKDGVNRGLADPGDIIEFALEAVNSAPCAAVGLQIIDRIPFFVTVDQGSIKLDGQTVNFTIAACPGDKSFNFCPGEEVIDTSRQCLTVDLGDLPANATKRLTYNVTVNDDLPEGANICNAALIGDRPVGAIVEGGVGITPGDGAGILRTTGSGGCSLNPATPTSEAWPVLAVGIFLALRRRLRCRPR